MILNGGDRSQGGAAATMKDAWAFVLSMCVPGFSLSLEAKLEKTGTQRSENQVVRVSSGMETTAPSLVSHSVGFLNLAQLTFGARGFVVLGSILCPCDIQQHP